MRRIISARAEERSDSAAPLEALLPPAMARRGEAIGVRKAGADALPTLVLAMLAGAFIALGGVFSTIAVAGTVASAAWGPVRVLAGLVFSLGLILVIVGGAELFTGNNLVVMAWASGRVSTAALARNWVIVLAGNFVGAAATALLVCLAGTHRLGDGAFGIAAMTTAHAKLQLGALQAVVLGILCNGLVCLAVWLTYSARTTTDRILAIIPPITAFVAAGFEHSIANMYFVPLALFVAALDPAFVTTAGLGAQAQGLSWSALLTRNLLPVTVGNVIGGSVLVAAVYWFVYLRGRPASAPDEREADDAPLG
jgi:formate/nitrite transporter